MSTKSFDEIDKVTTIGYAVEGLRSTASQGLVKPEEATEALRAFGMTYNERDTVWVMDGLGYAVEVYGSGDWTTCHIILRAVP